MMSSPAARACRSHRVHFGDDIGRQALDAVEIVGHGFFRLEEINH
jgi:hypothetical protein